MRRGGIFLKFFSGIMGKMDKKELEEIKGILLRMKEEIIREREDTLQTLSSETEDVFDEGERAFMEESNYLELRITTRKDKLLKKVEDALKRMEEGTFGICERCGREIEVERLKIRPVTTMCIECKKEEERMEEMEKKLKRRRL